MNDPLILLTPVLVFLILALIRFTGCASFGTAESSGKVEGPPLGIESPPPPPPPAPPPAPTYAEEVRGTSGFAVHWPLDETGGNVATAFSALGAAVNGQYVTGVPAGSGLTLGEPSVLAAKEKGNLAPRFDGTAAYVEVQYHGVLNPGNQVAGFTIELWIKPEPTLGSDTQVVVSSHRLDTQHGYEIALIRRPNEPHQQIRGRVFGGAGVTPVDVTVQPNQGNGNDWRYIVMNYEGTASGAGTLTLHVRIVKTTGRFQGGPRATGYINVSQATPSTLRFGAGHRSGQNSTFFAGQIDEVVFYNAILTQNAMDKRFNMV